MNVLRRSATGVLAALAVVVAGPALGAQAASHPLHFTTLASTDGGKIQGCRMSTGAAHPWRIKLRVNALKAHGRVNGSGLAFAGDQPVGRGWRSGWVRKGHLSSVGTVLVPRGTAYTLQAGIGAGQMGNGGTFAARSLRPCR